MRISRISGPLQDQLHRRGQTFPVFELALELPPTFARQPIELRFAPQVALFPLGRDPSLLLQTVQSRVQRALLHGEHFVRQQLNPLRDSPAMRRISRSSVPCNKSDGFGMRYLDYLQ